jgi:hypothetical protein
MNSNKSKDRSPVTFEQLVAGYEFPPSRYELKASVIAKYLEAVGRPNEAGSSAQEFVPPMAMVAYVMTAIAQAFSLPAGSIHASQELEFFKLVPVGATINCSSRVVQKLDRGKLRLLVIELGALNQDQEKVLAGQATIVVPS